tara:strand:+ start:261 stop:1169 length:909 start_codon:yes stop_codon:yes gene_type:complete
MSSLRRFTSQQFADGTTIDGNRLEKALQDLEDWNNGIEDSNFSNRWMQSQLILKYLPPTADSTTQLSTNTGFANHRSAPFLPIYNDKTDENPHRFKGTRLSWQEGYQPPTLNYDPTAAPPRTPDDIYKDQVVWTSLLAIGEDPVIIDSVDAVFLTYNLEYVNNWLYGSSSSGGPVGTYSNDIHLEITADNPFLPNLQLKNTILFHKYLSTAEAAQFCNQSINLATIDDMNPSLTSVSGMNPTHEHSLSMNLTDLNIPVPPFTRLRFALILPLDTNCPVWGDQPWTKFIPTMSLTILERTVSG